LLIVAVTLAVALHNIPEGMAVASPLYASTGSRWIAFKWCLLSALCEPAAALLFGVLFSSYLTPHIIAMLNAGVAGIMICLCLIELIPAACEHISPKVRARAPPAPRAAAAAAAAAAVGGERATGGARPRLGGLRALLPRVHHCEAVCVAVPPLLSLHDRQLGASLTRCATVPHPCASRPLQAAVLSNIAGQATMFLSLHAMRATGMH